MKKKPAERQTPGAKGSTPWKSLTTPNRPSYDSWLRAGAYFFLLHRGEVFDGVSAWKKWSGTVTDAEDTTYHATWEGFNSNQALAWLYKDHAFTIVRRKERVDLWDDILAGRVVLNDQGRLVDSPVPNAADSQEAIPGIEIIRGNQADAATSMTVETIGDLFVVTLRDAGNCELNPELEADLRCAREYINTHWKSQLGQMDLFFNFGLQGGWNHYQLMDLWLDPDTQLGESHKVQRARQTELPIISLDAPRGQLESVNDIEASAYVKIAEVLSGIEHPLCAMTGIDWLTKIVSCMRALTTIIYQLNVKAGWWHDLETGEPISRNDGELCMLMVSEISEGFEGIRKNLMDDKLPHRKMIEVELADTIIRILDYAGGRRLDVGGAIIEKLAFNQTREDHSRAARLAPNGKKV